MKALRAKTLQPGAKVLGNQMVNHKKQRGNIIFSNSRLTDAPFVPLELAWVGYISLALRHKAKKARPKSSFFGRAFLALRVYAWERVDRAWPEPKISLLGTHPGYF
jgi:hypothetical protein